MKDTDWIRLHQIIGQAVKDDLNIYINDMVQKSFLDADQVSVVKLRDVYESTCDIFDRIIKDIRGDLNG